MYRNILITICLILLFNFLNAQVSIEKSVVDYSLKIKGDSVYQILSFWKHKDSTIYKTVKYSVTDFNNPAQEKKLIKEISTIDGLWSIAKDSIKFDLQSFNIGYPLLYSDILKNHIRAFLDSEDWQNHLRQNGKKLNYEIIKRVMLDNNVYQPLNEFLKTKGYQISGFETEKHGFVTKENLLNAGYSGNEIIPMPFIVWVILNKYH
ncbi:MAG: hypothetical protein KOO66_06100 [Bacteroidales bacterium]|nr:hypothetical protein [Bacteroidales bacterium]